MAGGLGLEIDQYEVKANSEIVAFAQPGQAAPVKEIYLPREGDFSTVQTALAQGRRAIKDLSERGEASRFLDLRFYNQVIVGPKIKETAGK